MLLTKKVKIKINNGRYVKHFKELGYKFNFNDEIEVFVIELPKGSHIEIEASCDYCGETNKLFYKEYNYSIKSQDKYCCNNCAKFKRNETCLEKYGKDCYVQTEEFKIKSEKTQIKKYGKKFTKTKEFKLKVKKTNLKRYNVDHYSKTDEFKIRYEKISLEKFGVKHPMQNKKIKNKQKNTLKIKYGVEHALQNKIFVNKSKETSIRKYNIDNYAKTAESKLKVKNTCNIKYGIDNAFKLKKTQNKFKITSLIKYGVEYPMQNNDIFEKQQTSAFKCGVYNNIFYRGTYELDFLTKFNDKLNIEKIKSINYFFNGKNRKYHPDFYIKQYNLVVEIKSSYTYNYNIDMNNAKKGATILEGYNFIFIIDKDYTDFLNITSIN